MNIFVIYVLLYFIQLLLSQQCRDDDFIGFHFNSPTTTHIHFDSYPFSDYGLSKLQKIEFKVQIDCKKFTNTTLEDDNIPILYLSIHNQQKPDINIDAIEYWIGIAKEKRETLEDEIPDKKNKYQVFEFINYGWKNLTMNLFNATNSTEYNDELIPNWYNVWLFEANLTYIAEECNKTDADPLSTKLPFIWPYTQFFPILQNFDISNNQTWTDRDTQIPLEIVWNDDKVNGTIYNIVISKQGSFEWLICFESTITPLIDSSVDWQTDISSYYFDEEYDNMTYLTSSLWEYTLISSEYSPLIAYNNCNVSDKILIGDIPTASPTYINVSNITDSISSIDIERECAPNTCCIYSSSSSFFNIYFWYDDDVWTNSLALYQLLTQYSIEEAICDLYNDLNPNKIFNPDDFYLSVSYFFNFCLLQSGNCPNYETEKDEKKLTYFPSGIDSDNTPGYKMYATLRTHPLERAEAIYDMLTINKNAYNLIDLIKRRAQEDFGRINFEIHGIAISNLPQRIIFKVPKYISYGVYGFVGFCTLFAIAGAIHGFVYWGADCIRISGIVYFGLYTWDFYSDIVFDLELLNHSDTELLFYACTAFIIIPWISNMISLSKYQQRWCRDDAIRERVYSWFVSWQRLTYALAAISGSAFGTVELANSYVFGIDFFCMGLNERHLKRFNNNRLWSSIIAENVPQLIIQFLFLSLLDWDPSNNGTGSGDVVWLAIISSSLSIGAALLDIYSAKKLFDVLEPGGKPVGKISCSIHVLSQEIKENAKKLQVSTYALRDAIAETLTTHKRSVEMHFPITTADGFKIGFTVFSSELTAKEIYDGLRSNAMIIDVKIPAALPTKIQKVWRLDPGKPLPRIPINDIEVDGIDTEYIENWDFKLINNKNTTNTHFINNINNDNNNNNNNNNENEGQNIEMTSINNNNNNNNNNKQEIQIQEEEALNNKEEISDYDAQMAALNAQIAMNQYLMMKQLEYIQNDNDNDNDNNNDNNNNNNNNNNDESKLSVMQQLMMDQMQEMNGMINMSKPYDPNSFQQFNKEWQQQRDEYQPPQLIQQQNKKEEIESTITN